MIKDRVELAVSISNMRTLKDVGMDEFDAFYLGQPYCLKFNGNFLVEIEDLKTAVRKLKAAGKLAYLVTPALPKQSEMGLVAKGLEAADSAGIDAVETHDVGVFRFIKNRFPKMRVHVGNFANVYNERSAGLFKELGATRIVPNHELTRDELAKIASSVEGVEFERPVHGALSLGMAYACVFVSEDGGCRQQCSARCFLKMDGWEMRTVGTSLLMGADFCLLEHLISLLEIGLKAWRLETYFDDAQKINMLGQTYRQAAGDAYHGRSARVEAVAEVTELSDRELCNGWHFGRSGREYQSLSEADVKKRA